MIASLQFVFSYVCVGPRARFNSLCATFWTGLVAIIHFRNAPHPFPLPIRWGEGGRRPGEGFVCFGNRSIIRSSLGWQRPAGATLRPPLTTDAVHTLFRKAVEQ